MQYDLSASQFSPDGRVFQVEYAQKAIENSGYVRRLFSYNIDQWTFWTFSEFSSSGFSTVIGLRGKDGVVLAVEKLVTSKLYEPGANKRIFTIDTHIGMVSEGHHIVGRRKPLRILQNDSWEWTAVVIG